MTAHRRPHLGLVMAAAAVLAIAVAMLLVSHSPTTPRVEGLPPASPTAAVAVAAPVTDPLGPAAHRHGVPVGWRHDTPGAMAAATGYVRASELVAAAGPLERQDIIGAFTTAAFGPTLAAKTNGQLDDLLFELGARGHVASDLTWREFPLAVHADTTAVDQVSVQVWSVSVILVAGGSVARQSWHTETLTLVWQAGDWKVDGWATTTGPTPGLSSEADLSPVAAVQANATWAPAVSGGS